MSRKMTKIDPASSVKNVGDFTRKGIAIHSISNELVPFAATNPYGSFGMFATTATEHGTITVRKEDKELVFVPHVPQNGSPKYWRLKTKRAMRIFNETI